MSKVRHWKEKFAADADFVYAKTLKLGGGIWTKPGDPVDKEMLGRNVKARLRRWWDAGVIRLAEFAPPVSTLTGRSAPVAVQSMEDNAEVEEPVAAIESQDDENEFEDLDAEVLTLEAIEGFAIEHLGGPWYRVHRGVEEYKIKGRKAAEAKARELR